MAEWEKVKVGDIGKVITGKTPKTYNSEYYDGNIPFLTPSDDMSVKYVRRTNKYITELGRLSVKNATLPANAICVSCIGSDLGKVVITTQETVTNQQINSIVVDTDKFDIDFVYYSMLELGKVLNFHSKTSTAVPIVNKSSFSQYEIDCPKLNTQKRIGAILSSIDKKIEENNQINENLQQQAQALFKSWFLDYEPWDGTAPNSWLHGKLGDYANIKRGGSPRPIQEYLSDSGLRWLKISDVTGLQTPFIIDIKDHIIEEGLKKTVFLKSGSLVLSNSATPGIPKILDVDSCIHDGWLYFPESKFSNEYLYLYFKYIRQQLVNLSNGSVFNNLKTDILKGYPTILPDEETLQRFDGIIKPMFLQMQNLTRESHDLIDLRDTILPRLMSGELDVSGIQL